MNRTYLTFEEVHDAPAVQSGANDSTRPLTDRIRRVEASEARLPEWVRRMREGQLRAKALEA